MVYNKLTCFAALLALHRANSKKSNSFTDNLLNPESTLGHVQLCVKEIYHPNMMFILGVASNFNVYLGVGYFNHFEFYGWPVQFKSYVLFLDYLSFEKSSHYLKKMPLNVSLSTEAWGFCFGAQIGANLNRKTIYSVFCSFKPTDYVDCDIHWNVRGTSDFLAKEQMNIAEVKAFIKDCKVVKDEFVSFCKQKANYSVSSSQVHELIAEHYGKVGEYLSNLVTHKNMEEEFKGLSHLIFGRAGSGKNYATIELLKEFAKTRNLGICVIDATFSEVSPTGYKGEDAREIIKNVFEGKYAEGHNAIEVRYSIILFDEFDSIANKDSGDNFKGAVQKELLKAVDGNYSVSTSKGEISLAPTLRFMAGAFEQQQDNMDMVANEEIIKNLRCFDYANHLFKYLKNQVLSDKHFSPEVQNIVIQIKRYLNEYKKRFALVMTESKERAPMITEKQEFKRFVTTEAKTVTVYSELEKSNFAVIWLKDNSLKRGAEIIAGEIKKFKEAIQKSKNILDEYKKDFSKCDSLYLSYFECLQNLSNLFDEEQANKTFADMLWITSRLYKQTSSKELIASCGVGGEVCRRADKVFYLERPDHRRTILEFEKSLYPFLKGLKVNGVEDDEKFKKLCFSIFRKEVGDKKQLPQFKDVFNIINELKEDLTLEKNMSLEIVEDGYGGYEVANPQTYAQTKSLDAAIKEDDEGESLSDRGSNSENDDQDGK